MLTVNQAIDNAMYSAAQNNQSLIGYRMRGEKYKGFEQGEIISGICTGVHFDRHNDCLVYTIQDDNGQKHSIFSFCLLALTDADKKQFGEGEKMEIKTTILKNTQFEEIIKYTVLVTKKVTSDMFKGIVLDIFPKNHFMKGKVGEEKLFYNFERVK